MGSETNENRCVQCGFRTNQLFVLYSPGNLHLMKCDNCQSVADEYLEFEVMIVLIDLILHKRQAYRHLLYNLSSCQDLIMWKFGLSFLLLDACIQLPPLGMSCPSLHHNFSSSFETCIVSRLCTWTLATNQLDRYMLLRLGDKQSSMNFSSTIGICQKTLMDVSLGNIMFLCALHILSRVFLRSSAGVHKYRYGDIFFAIIISSYFKIFLVSMMVWEFPSTVIFIIDLFVLSSNAVALKVVTESALSRCIGTCLCAHGAKFLATKLFEK